MIIIIIIIIVMIVIIVIVIIIIIIIIYCGSSDLPRVHEAAVSGHERQHIVSLLD